MEKVIGANARVAAGKTTICTTRYGNVMCSRGSVIPLFIDQIKAGNSITITDPNMTRFLMNLDEAVALVMFAFENGEPGDLFVQKSDASTIGDLAKAVQQLFGDTGTKIIGTRHGEKLFETLMTNEECVRSIDMGNYYRVLPDGRDLNYDKFFVNGEVQTMSRSALLMGEISITHLTWMSWLFTSTTRIPPRKNLIATAAIAILFSILRESIVPRMIRNLWRAILALLARFWIHSKSTATLVL